MSFTQPPAIPPRGAKGVFSGAVDAFIRWMTALPAQLDAFLARLETIAAGGAYSIPYRVNSGPGALSYVAAASPSAATTTSINIDYIASDGTTHRPAIASFLESTSAVKGTIRIQKTNDPGRWTTHRLTGVTLTESGYANLTLTPLNASSDNPFAEGDDVMLFFDRTGDKGQQGDAGITASVDLPQIYVREEYANGTGPTPTNLSGGPDRAFNAVKVNTLSGASLSGGRVTVPGGTYKYSGSAPAAAVGAHRVVLYNYTDNVVVEYGSSEYAGSNTQSVVTRSSVRGRIAFNGPKSLGLRHYGGGSTNAMGIASSLAGGVEVFGELLFEKVA